MVHNSPAAPTSSSKTGANLAVDSSVWPGQAAPSYARLCEEPHELRCTCLVQHADIAHFTSSNTRRCSSSNSRISRRSSRIRGVVLSS